MTPFKSMGLIFTIAILCGCNRGDNSTSTTPQPAAASNGNVASRSFTAIEAGPAGAIEVQCAIDKINSQPAAGRTVNVEAGRAIQFTGWISDPTKQVPAKFTIVLTGPGSFGVAGVAGINRPDVAKALASTALAKSGFNVSAALGSVAVGKYAVHIAEDVDGKPARCTTNTHVEVIKPAE